MEPIAVLVKCSLKGFLHSLRGAKKDHEHEEFLDITEF